MDSKHVLIYIALLLCLHLTLITESTARSTAVSETYISAPVNNHEPLNNDYFANYKTRQVTEKYSLLNRLRRGYYYIDEGQITPVNPLNLNQNVLTIRRRQDSFSNRKDKNVKPKKLFVPNLFG